MLVMPEQEHGGFLFKKKTTYLTYQVSFLFKSTVKILFSPIYHLCATFVSCEVQRQEQKQIANKKREVMV